VLLVIYVAILQNIRKCGNFNNTNNSAIGWIMIRFVRVLRGNRTFLKSTVLRYFWVKKIFIDMLEKTCHFVYISMKYYNIQIVSISRRQEFRGVRFPEVCIYSFHRKKNQCLISFDFSFYGVSWNHVFMKTSLAH
jgi:hypothetical protein